MKALILYVGFVIIGGVLAALIGYYVERQTNSAISLIVFLSLFFANFIGAWIGTVLVMDGSLSNAFARQEQLDAEKAGKARMKAAS
jgi:fluoride ion exporter CrcB/FEX